MDDKWLATSFRARHCPKRRERLDDASFVRNCTFHPRAVACWPTVPQSNRQHAAVLIWVSTTNSGWTTYVMQVQFDTIAAVTLPPGLTWGTLSTTPLDIQCRISSWILVSSLVSIMQQALVAFTQLTYLACPSAAPFRGNLGSKAAPWVPLGQARSYPRPSHRW
jgi:hypothetical protein